MKYLIYMSSAVNWMNEQELRNLLERSRLNNLNNHVTGILLYFDGAFMQLLEGMPEDVDAVFKAIENDSRHYDIIKIVDRPLQERNFPEWSMGFSSINCKSGAKLATNIEFDELSEYPGDHRAITILKTFISTHKVLASC
jgi:hypothetical protein